MISVVIPVGPFPANRRWLSECLASVAAQTVPPAEVVIIDDMAGLDEDVVSPLGAISAHLWSAPWRLGVAHAFNFGVGLALQERILFLGSDDTLDPECIAACDAAWAQRRNPLGYYWLDVEYQDTKERQSIACNAAMVTKALWRHTGGFPVESALGAPDAALLSIMAAAKGRAGECIRVPSDRPLYRYRRHTETDTAYTQKHFAGAILAVRDTLTRIWEPPVWGRV